MRNRLRVLAFDVLAPLAAVVALTYIGVALAWPRWWVAVFSVLCLLIVEGVVLNFVLARRDAVTMGTDDDGPGLRLAVVGTATAVLVAAAVVGYTQWTIPARTLQADTTEVAGIASSVAEASATFTPQNPTASIDRAAGLMSPRAPSASAPISPASRRTWPDATCRRRRARCRRVSRRSARRRRAWR